MDEKYKNYIGLDEEYSSFKKSKVAIVQAPYDKTTTYIHGTAGGPAAIIDASRYLELFDDELNQETYRIGIHTAEPLNVEKMPPEMLRMSRKNRLLSLPEKVQKPL